MKKAAIVMLLLLGLSVSFLGCAREDAIALQVAKEWSQNNVTEISEDIGKLLSGDIPILKQLSASVVEDQLRQGVSWSYLPPEKISDGLYEVVAQARSDVSFDLPILGTRSYVVSFDYILQVDTQDRRIISSSLDPSSFSVD